MFRLEVIDYFDPANQSLVARVPEAGTAAIQYGAQLIVQQSQEAIFFRDGRAMDSFGPGRYTLTTANIPILGKILTLPFERSPFQACVYFIGKQTFIDQRWGTRTPITIKDSQFGLVRLRGYGKFAYRVVDGPLLLNTIVGSQGKFTTEEIVNYLRDVIVAGLTDLLASSGIGLIDMPSRMDDLSAAARVKLGEQFTKYGLELTEFFISSVTAPDEVQKAIDARASMAVLGDLNAYATYSAANAMQAAGAAGVNGPMGIGLGMVVPSMFPNANAAPNRPLVTSGGINPPSLDFSAAKVPTNEDVASAVEGVGSKLGWGIQKNADGHLSISVPLASSRRQRVQVELDRKDHDGNSVIGIWSPCGAINPTAALTVLRNNDSVIHGAFAMKRVDDGEILVLKSNVLSGLTNVGELAKIISAIAWQADEVEQQLSGTSSEDKL